MEMKKYPNIIGVGAAILAAGTTVPGWWKRMTYAQGVRDFSHATLLRSLLLDIEAGEDVPAEVLKDFPEVK